jgi:hypothetical protein
MLVIGGKGRWLREFFTVSKIGSGGIGEFM